MKMNCTDINSSLDDYLDKALSSLEITAFEQHLAKCIACKNRVDEAGLIREELRNIAIPESSPGFERRVFENVRKHYPTETSWNFTPKLAAGIASLSAVSLAVWLIIGQQASVTPTIESQIISIALNKTHPVRLMFDSDKDIKQAELSINLPENVELEGYPGHKRLKWHTNLKKGQNLLALPVKATNIGQGELHTQLRYNNSVKTHDFLLNAAETSGNDQPNAHNLIHKF